MRIALSQREIRNENYYEIRDALSRDWAIFLQELDFIPFPVLNSPEYACNYLDAIKPDAIILTGGNNISPKLYGGDERIDDVSDNRDATEIQMIRYSMKRMLPLLGVCRGMQMLQVFFGGRLTKISLTQIQHVNSKHHADICDEWFKEELGSDAIVVNSYHNYGVMREELADNLKPFAVSEGEDIVEGFYHAEYPIIGVQWHPERKYGGNEIDKKIIDLLLSKKRGVYR